jgi:poly [ADP-ribose] polymerase
LLDIFEVNREGEEARYKKNIPNQMLLWHGSRLSNLVGILSQGLSIAPAEAPSTGYMFGKGVYFADMVSKAADYCFASRDQNVICIFLCEVALGEMNELLHADCNASNLPKDKFR